MKTCFKCQRELPLSDFYKHKQMADGHLNKCKDCTKKDATVNRWKNIDRIRAYDRGRGNRQASGYVREYRARFPLKYKAVNMVNNAIRDKKLFSKPCEACGSERSVHGHHDDYAEPLNVRWLCAICHKRWHEDNGEGLNAASVRA